MQLLIGEKICPEDTLEDGMPVNLDGDELFQHVTMLGKSGAGKSMELLGWIVSFIMSRSAVILVEPMGTLSQLVYSASRAKAIYSSLNNPVPINPMLLPFDPSTVSSICKEAMNQVVVKTTKSANKETTVKMGNIFDAEVKESLAGCNPSLLDVRNRIATRRGDAETRDGLIARLDYMLSDPRMRHILCGPGTLDIGKLTSEGQTFIMDCRMMTTDAQVFSGNVISQAVKAHLSFADLTKTKPLCLAMDEAHLFVSPLWADLLKMGRHAQLCCIICSQELIFFPEELRRVLLNVGSLVTFRLGANEASYASRELHLRPEVIQFEEKFCLHYLTPSQRGAARAPSPPVMKKYPLPTAVPVPIAAPVIAPAIVPPLAPTAPTPTTAPSIINPVITKPMTEIRWFPIVPLPAETTNSTEAPAEVQRAETGCPSIGGATP